MRIDRPFLYKVLATISCILFVTACAPIEKGNLEKQGSSREASIADTSSHQSQDLVLPDTFTMLPDPDAEQDSMLQGDVEPEPEQTIDQELLDLQRLGTWEQGVPAQVYTEDKVDYDFPVTVNRQVEYYLDFFTGKGRRSFALWLARSGRYVPMIHHHLDEAGLPKDLAYLAMIESGYNERAYSRAKAVGIWQFITSTGRNYGLKINTYVDERRDPVKSTRAAVAYLSALYDEFDSWYLAVAAYNAGEGKIRKAIRKYKTTDFWKIAQSKYLKLETKRYVPKLIAAIIIAKEPGKYGFDNIQYDAALDYETVNVPRWTSIKAVALACNMHSDELRKYNNELRKEFTPPDRSSYPFKVPVGKGRDVKEKLPRVQAVVSTGFKTHTVRAGETLDSICRKYNLTKTVVLKSNNLRSAGLQPGMRLRIPYQTTTYEMLPVGAVARGYLAAESLDGSFIIHKVRPGDTIYELARLYNVPVHLIAGWNDIDDISRIRAGQQLVFYVRNTGINRVADTSSSGKTLKQLTPERLKEAKVDNPGLQVNGEPVGLRTELAKADTNAYYQVKEGDSLWSIARQYSVDVHELKNRNGLASNVIHPGDRIQVEGIAGKTAAEFHYQVRSGDSLWSIARQHDVSPDEIKKWNNLSDNVIHPGNRLVLRTAYAGEPVVDTYYQVRSGDSLWSIARQHDVSPDEIKKWNNLKNSTIHPGNRLILKIASGG